MKFVSFHDSNGTRHRVRYESITEYTYNTLLSKLKIYLEGDKYIELNGPLAAIVFKKLDELDGIEAT